MNKTELRSLLSRKYGVKLSPEEFKASTVDTLINMVELKEQEAQTVLNNNTNKGDVNMTNNNTVVGVIDIDKVNELAKLIRGQADEIISKTEVIVTNTTSTIIVPAIEGSEIRIIGSLTTKIEELTKKVQSLSVSNNVSNTNRTGVVITKCAICGFGIESPEVVKVSTERHGAAVCWNCQKSVKPEVKAKLQAMSKSMNRASDTQEIDRLVTTRCMKCGKEVKLTIGQIESHKKRAKEIGLAVGPYHIDCAEQAKLELQHNAPIANITNNTNTLFNPPANVIQEANQNNGVF